MNELTADRVEITDAFWKPRLAVNAGAAIEHQWEQLDRTGCLQNFRLAAGEGEGFREGWFFADSDAYKWLDAACRIVAVWPVARLRERIDALVALIATAQEKDGYLFTYNQLHFPGQRWQNLQIEHELYCQGHLIEAAVAHYRATGSRDLLAVAEKAAGLLVDRFAGCGPRDTPGHEEIELALIKLYRGTGAGRYLDLAAQFLEQRGRIKAFALELYAQNRSATKRRRSVDGQRADYLAAHPAYVRPALGPNNEAQMPPGINARYRLSALSGRYFQQHRPVRAQRVPVGHAVRFAYLQTALAMLYRDRGDETLLPALEAAWERMVDRRMYATGGIGALPAIEGFGRDDELDPEVAYAETCAALGCLFWNWEMTLATGRARYADLFEWQLYNAAAVGMGLDGRSYLYNNPLACRGGITRLPWFEVPCCPSNLSRTWADLGRYLFSCGDGALWLHQYVGCRTTVDPGVEVALQVSSALPWQGRVELRLEPKSPTPLTIYLRLPGWASGYRLSVNGEAVPGGPQGSPAGLGQTAAGIDPTLATYLPLRRTWAAGDRIELELAMPVEVRRPHPRVKAGPGMAALTRGPLVYCLESIDNPSLDLFAARLDRPSLNARFSPQHFGGTWLLQGRTTGGSEVTAIPYALWGNRGESQMTVMVQVTPG